MPHDNPNIHVPYRCEHPDGDVKFAAIEEHALILEGKGYLCEYDPDQRFTLPSKYLFAPDYTDDTDL